MATNEEPSAFAALWRTVVRLDKAKINSTWMATRNALAVSVPLAIGINMGNPLGAVAITTGALNVSYSDGHDPYIQRARRMLTWTIFGAVAVFVGSVTGRYHLAAIVAVAIWGFLGGIAVAISSRAGDLGLNTLVTLIVFGARGALPPEGALIAALLVLAGGLLQTGLALLFWPLRKYKPECSAISGVYAELARQIDPHFESSQPEPLKPPTAEVQDTLDALGRDHSVEGERFRLLLDQADRIRISAFTLVRLREALAEESNAGMQPTAKVFDLLERFLVLTSRFSAVIANSLSTGKCADEQTDLLDEMEKLCHELEEATKEPIPLGPEIVSAAAVVAGQLRSVNRLATTLVPEGLSDFEEREYNRPFRFQLAAWIETVRANIDVRSAAFRHAIRMAVCVAIGDAIGRSISWQRSYWIPMTIAVVLKPDFNTTISRGILRLAGTFGGLLLATLLYHILPASALTQLLLVGVFTFALRRWGPANYGVFSVAVSGLIVFLIAATGIAPADVVAQRSINTLAGGLFALAAYALWPTWERRHVQEELAQMLDATRAYFHAVVERFGRDDGELERTIEDARSAWRLSRSAAESSVDRVTSEPKATKAQAALLTSILASSHALVHATIALEAGFAQIRAGTPPAVFRTFTKDVELTLYYLAASLRGSPGAAATLPHLREDHQRMVQARNRFAATDEFVLLETDRITTSLNTLREQVERLVSGGETPAPVSHPAPAGAV